MKENKFFLICVFALAVAFALGACTSCMASSCANQEDYAIYRVIYPAGMRLRAYPTTSADALSHGFDYGDFIVTSEDPITKGDSTWIHTTAASGTGYVCFYDEDQVYLEELFGSLQKVFPANTTVYSDRFIEEGFVLTSLKKSIKLDVLSFENSWYVVIWDGQVGYIPA